MTYADQCRAEDPGSDDQNINTVKREIIILTENKNIYRERIADRCKKLLSGGFGLVVAPAGYGKTTFIKQWLRENALPSIWFNATTEHNDLRRFLTAFSNAMRSEGLNTAPLDSILRSGYHPSSQNFILDQLISIFSTENTRCTVVFDDLHLIQDNAVYEFLEKFVSGISEKWIILLLSRSEPPMALGMLRLNKNMVEIRKELLAFSFDEGRAFFTHNANLSISDTGIRQILTRTEGWPAGFRLVEYALENTVIKEGDIFGVEKPFVKEYLLEEVFSVQTQPVKEFLLLSSILGRFSPELCDYAFKRADSSRIINTIRNKHLFIEQPHHQNRWFRYHNLFSDFLREQGRSMDKRKIKEILLRTAEWYQAKQDWKRSLDCYFRSAHYQQFIDLLKDHIGDLFIGGWYSKIKHWLDQVPRNIFRKEKQILVYLALSNIMLGDRREGKEILDALDMSDNRVDDLLSYMIYCGAIYLLHFNHQIPQMLALANKIVGKYPPGMESWNAGVEMILAKGETVMGNIAASNQRLNGIIAFALKEDLPLLNLTAAVQLAINYIHQGDLAYAKMTCKKYIRRSDWHSFPLVGLFYAVLGDIQREHGQLEESRVNIQTAREYIHLVGGIGALGWIELTYFRIQFALGNLVQCEDILENLDTQLHSADAPPWLLDGLYAAKIKLWNVLGKKKRIQNFVAEKHTFFSGNINFSNFQSHLEYIHYLIISPDEDQAVDFVTNKRMYLEKAVALASESRWIDLLIRCSFIARQAAGNEPPYGGSNRERFFVVWCGFLW